MKRILWFPLTVSAVLFSYGCKESEPEEFTNISGNTVSFIIGNDSAVSKSTTRAAIYDLGSDGLSIIETVSSMDGASAPTKGTPVYTENFDALYGSSLYATAYVPSAGSEALADVWGSFLENGGTVKLNNCSPSTYSYNYNDLAWPSDGELHYFLQAPYAATSRLDPVFYADGHIEFDYADPVSAREIEGRNVIIDPASSQSDILFTSKIVGEASCAVNPPTLQMHHCLTAVKFRVGGDDEEVETIIHKIKFARIKANGHCIVDPSGGTTWSSHSQDGDIEADYSQSFSGTVDFDDTNSNFGESFYTNGTNLRNLGKADGSEILLMVPQTLKDVELEVEYTIKKKGASEGIDYHKSVKMSSVWKAGEIHTYTLTLNTVAVEVDDSMNSAKTVKSDVKAMNTGNVTAYLRAACVVAWYYGVGDSAVAVAPYEGDGTIVGLGGDDGSGNTWLIGSDGFYYYRYPVLPGNNAGNDIFSSFAAPQTAPPFAGAHLEMKLLLQGVQYDSAKEKVASAWGGVYMVDASGNVTSTTIVSQLSDNPEQ